MGGEKEAEDQQKTEDERKQLDQLRSAAVQKWAESVICEACSKDENDDCVMSMMLSVRMMQILQNWDEKIGDLLRDDFDDQELMEPLPMTMAFR